MSDARSLKAAWAADPTLPHYTYRVEAGLAEPTTHATARSISHAASWTMTVNERIGGNGADPTPGDVVLAALAGCHVLAIRGCAVAMGVTLERVDVTVEGDVDHRGVMLMDPAVRAGFSAIRVKVHVEAPGLAPEKLRKLLAAAERSCAVTDALRNATPLSVEIV